MRSFLPGPSKPALAIAVIATVAVLGLAACSSSGSGGSAGTSSAGAGGASSNPASSGGGRSDPIILGQIASLTGNYTPLGSNDKLGAAQAVAEINSAGGLLGGRPLKIVLKDDKTQPNQAVTDYNDLVSKNVAAVVGSSFSNSSLAIIPIAQRKMIPYVSTAASDPQVHPVHSYAFMTPPTAGSVAEQLLRYFKSKGMTKMAIGYATDQAFGKTGEQDMTKMASKYGIKFVDTETFESSTTNFSPVLTHVRSSGAYGMMVWATGAPAVIITKQFASAGLKMPLVMSHAEASTLYTKPAGSAAKGVIVASSLAVVGPDLPSSKVKKTVLAMAKPFQKANKYYPPQFAFDGYCAVKLIAAAITQAKSADPSKIDQALNHLTQATPEGTYHYTSDDHSGLTVDDVAITRVQANGSFKPTKWSSQQLQKTLK
jgi:branched-chain amino acid transport system substrate-binding protein